MVKKWENNGIEEISLVTPTPDFQHLDVHTMKLQAIKLTSFGSGKKRNFVNNVQILSLCFHKELCRHNFDIGWLLDPVY